MTNNIHPTAILPDGIILGQYNTIGENVRIEGFKGLPIGPIVLGDCNTLHEGVKILVGPEGFRMGDWNTIHNGTSISGSGAFVMGHNCWIGQEAYLDCSGGLTIGNGVTIGVRSCIWTHIGRGEQIEGWMLASRPTTIKDDVWLVGNNVHVAPGVVMGERSVALAQAVVAHDTEPDWVYAGIPAEKCYVKIRREVILKEKWAMMWKWANEFADDGITECHMAIACPSQDGTIGELGEEYISMTRGGEQQLWIGCNTPRELFYGPSKAYFNLVTKTYTKRLTQLERDFIAFLKDNKARFLPQNDSS